MSCVDREAIQYPRNGYLIGLVSNRKSNGATSLTVETEIKDSMLIEFLEENDQIKTNPMKKYSPKSKYFKKEFIRIEGYVDPENPIVFEVNNWVIIEPYFRFGRKTNLVKLLKLTDERLINHIKTLIEKAFEKDYRYGKFIAKKFVTHVIIKENLIKICANNTPILKTLDSLFPKKIQKTDSIICSTPQKSICCSVIVNDEKKDAEEVVCDNEVLFETQIKDTVSDEDSQLSLPEKEINDLDLRQTPFVDDAEKNNCEDRMDERPNEEMLIPVVFEEPTTQITPSSALLSNPLPNPPSTPSSTQTTTPSTTLPTQNEKHGEDEEDERRSRKRSKPTTESEGPRPKQELGGSNNSVLIKLEVISSGRDFCLDIHMLTIQPTQPVPPTQDVPPIRPVQPTQEVESTQSSQESQSTQSSQESQSTQPKQ